MVTRFGSREICDVTFKALSDITIGKTAFKAGQPVFVIDTATASSMEQATTTNYAYGGRGYNRLMSWEGEKTVTFTVTDALMSPLGLSVLSGAGFEDASADNKKHIHITMDAKVNEEGNAIIKNSVLINELGLPGTTTQIEVCMDAVAKPQGTILDNNGAIIGWVAPGSISATSSKTTGSTEGAVTFAVTGEDYKGKTIKFDFYVVMQDNCTVISIKPGDFGGYFYVEADTLYRNQDGKDMAATLTFPKVKVQSGFTISMAPNGDPSTFDFVMDAFPAYTKFDTTKQVVCDIAIVGGGSVEAVTASHTTPHNDATITVPGDDDGDEGP
jgi:hypothetical protein